MSINIKHYANWVLALAFPSVLGAQATLNLQEAVSKVLSANDQLQIQAQYIQISENNINKALTGQLPEVNAVATGSYTNNRTDVELRTFQPEPPVINIGEWGVESFLVNVGAEASYVLFDGGQAKVRYQLFKGLNEIERNKQEVIANGLITAVVNLYFELFKLQNQQAILLESIAVNEERVQKLKNSAEFGKATSLDILQAQTNINKDRSALENLKLAESQLLIELKTLMEDDTDNTYQMAAVNQQVMLPNQEQVLATIIQQNPELKLAQSGINLADIQVMQNTLTRMPTVAAFANVGYFFQQNDVQQLKEIQNIGGTIGISARYNLYDGGARKIKLQNAAIGRTISKMQYEDLKELLHAKARKELITMQNINALIALETANLEVYEETYSKIKDRNAVGQVPEITLREVQLAVINSKILLNTLQADFQKSFYLLNLIMGRAIE